MSIAQSHVSLAGISNPRTFDPSAGQAMPDYSEPQFSSGGCADELSAAGQQYALAKMNSYAAAHLEADADDLMCELDHLRNEQAGRDLTPAEFAAALAKDAPGLLYSMSATQYVASHISGPPDITIRFEGWCAFTDGSPVRHLSGASWRELAERIVTEHKARKGMGRAVPVVEAAVAAGAE